MVNVMLIRNMPHTIFGMLKLEWSVNLVIVIRKIGFVLSPSVKNCSIIRFDGFRCDKLYIDSNKYSF